MSTLNWATASRGAKLIDYSSQLGGCSAANVLDDDISNIWLSENGAPQWLCISLANLERESVILRTIGWHCWHAYLTNPKLVSMHVSGDGAKFKLWDTFVCKQMRGTQLFSCAPVDTSIYPYIALEVAQTFGGAQTYMNRVFMYSDEVTASPGSSKADTNRSGSTSSIESPEVHPNNLSDISGLSVEHSNSKIKSYSAAHRGSVMASQDTDQLVAQLQDALGLGSNGDVDKSFIEEDNREAELGGTYDLHPQPRQTPGSATVAERLTHLETTVSALGHTLIDHYASASVSPSLSRHQTPPSRSRAQSQTTPPSSSSSLRESAGAGRSASSWRSPAAARRSHSPQLTSPGNNRAVRLAGNSSSVSTSSKMLAASASASAPLEVVYQRMHSLEEKFSRLFDVLEERQQLAPQQQSVGAASYMETPASYNTQQRPPPPPPPPPPPLQPPPSSAHTLASNTTRSISNVTSSSSKSQQRLHFDPALQSSPRSQYRAAAQYHDTSAGSGTGSAFGTRAGSSGSDPAVERVVHRIETMVDRVWDKYNQQYNQHYHQQYHQHRQSGSATSPLRTISNSSSRVPRPGEETPASATTGSKGSAEKGTSPMRKWVESSSAHEFEAERRTGRTRDRTRDRDIISKKGRPRSTDKSYRSKSKSKSRSTSRGRDAAMSIEHLHRHPNSSGGLTNRNEDSEDINAQAEGSNVHRYVSSNTERLLRRERVRQLIQENEQHHHTHRHHSHSRSRSPSQRKHNDLMDDASSTGSTSDEKRGSYHALHVHKQHEHRHRHRHRQHYNHESAPAAAHPTALFPGVQADNVLERSIFELLKSKYGLSVSSDAAAATAAGAGADSVSGPVVGHTTATPAVVATGLPMRAPADQPCASVVDWPQYVHNRLASRASVTGELTGGGGGSGIGGGATGGGSPLRPGVRGVYTVAGVLVNNSDNMDVLPRAKQDLRIQRMERELELTGNSTAAAVTSAATNGYISAPANSQSSSSSSQPQQATASIVLHDAAAATSTGMLPGWCAQDPEISELVKALQHKVYQRTIKEAQYEMLISSSSQQS